MKYRDAKAEGKAEQEKYFGEAASIFVYAEKEGSAEAANNRKVYPHRKVQLKMHV